MSTPGSRGPDADGAVEVLVCTACEDGEGGAVGRALVEAVRTAVGETVGEAAIAVVPVGCLAVCDRPATVAFRAAGKWTYVVAGVEPAAAHDVVAAARAVAASPHGVPPMAARPPFFRNGVVARLPPSPD
ncbi:DUF1636 family protein [Acuticoccus mangrovi]|uniref:DUF1636 domain-containing protein n=1 Tax=Acuticoccus mangrovi TaxID=2796142 RepID=A0A934MDG2_9HYPH|nr:DUF1636 family protein [Acuticoccus mangrovi]MBJ3776322.1 DUF1636 domain-containing protein [Acuticoccus mangrovi]